MLELDDFRFYVKCFVDFRDTLDKLEEFYINLDRNEEVEYFIGNYSEMLAKMLGLEEHTDDFEAFQSLLYGGYEYDYQLNEATKLFWDTLQRPKVYFNVDANQTKKSIKVAADDLDRCADTFLRRVYTDLLNTWENAHKDASDNNIIPYEIQEINPDKER